MEEEIYTDFYGETIKIKFIPRPKIIGIIKRELPERNILWYSFE